jgi:hypothetical protein
MAHQVKISINNFQEEIIQDLYLVRIHLRLNLENQMIPVNQMVPVNQRTLEDQINPLNQMTLVNKTVQENKTKTARTKAEESKDILFLFQNQDQLQF